MLLQRSGEANPSFTTTYTVTKTTTANGCTDTDDVQVNIYTNINTADAGSDFTKDILLVPI